MINSFLKKGSFLASFFIVNLLWISSPLCAEPEFNPKMSIDTKEITKLAGSPAWHALLHWDGRTHHINDQTFLLSHDNFSPENELFATLDYLYFGTSNPQCRFPARYLFLKKNLQLPELNIRVCNDLVEFENKAPIDQLYLVFASEDISRPTSMMGHVLIKISGSNDQEVKVEHAISFFTDIQGFNLTKIIYENMIYGKKGYFSLSPYQESLTRYNQLENRNLWEYELEGNDYTRQLIQYHFFELKQTNLVYLFKDYNCATLTQFIVAIAASDIASTRNIFGVTPTDVVKQAYNANLIKSVLLIPATRWKMRMLGDALDSGQKNLVKVSVLNNDISAIDALADEKTKYIAYTLANDYAKLQEEARDITPHRKIELQEKIEAGKSSLGSFHIDLSEYKNPIKTPDDSQFVMGAFRYRDSNYMKISFLPSSHKLEDDNRQYFGETELTLGEVSIALSLDSNAIFLDSFTLYGVSSLIPYNTFSGGISGRFRMGMQQQIYRDWERHGQAYVEGALGSTIAISSDINLYGLLGVGLASSRLDTYAEIAPEIGIVIKEVFNMKSIIRARRTIADSVEVPHIDELSITQAFYLNSKWSVFFKVKRITIGALREDEFALDVKQYF